MTPKEKAEELIDICFYNIEKPAIDNALIIVQEIEKALEMHSQSKSLYYEGVKEELLKLKDQ